MSESTRTLLSANALTGELAVYTQNTYKPALVIADLPTDERFIKIHRQLEQAIRIAEKEAYKHAADQAQKAIRTVASKLV